MKKGWLLVTAISETLNITRQSSSSRPFCSQTTSTFAVKKVTTTNFDSALQDLRHLVRDADFVAVDLEMTGITSTPWRECFDYDRLDVKYLKVKDSAEKFAVLQFGICPFRWDSSKELFIAHPHTFYVFPRKELPLDSASFEFLCQTTSLEFLAKYQFDFNACIYEGISYLSRAQESEALDRLNTAHEDELSNSDRHWDEVMDIPSVGIADVLFTERMKKRFLEWRDGLWKNTNGEFQIRTKSNDSKAQLQIIFFNMHPALELNGFTSHQLRLIQLVIRKHFQDLIYIRTTGENGTEQKLVVYTDSDNDKHLLLKEVTDTKRKEAEMKVNAAVGFRHVIDLLTSQKKLVVGHNCFLDVAHIHNKFLGPLPSRIEEFASSINEHFPCIIDTKYLLVTDNRIQCMMKKSNTSLSKAFAFMCPQASSVSKSSSVVSLPNIKFEVQVDEMRSSNWNSGANHEAGYDAFMTGCVFAQACSHLGIDFKLRSPSTRLACNEKLRQYMNLLYVSWRNGSIIDLCTGKETPEFSINRKFKQHHPKVIFQNIILLWGFSSSLKPVALKECLSKTFGQSAIASVYYLDKTAAFIQFSKKEFVSDFLALKETLETNNDAISVLHPLQKILEGGDTHAADYEAYKEICGSSLSKVMFADQANAVDIKRKIVEEESSGEAEQKAEFVADAAGTSHSDSVTTSETGLELREIKKDTSDIRLSCLELMEALCGSEADHDNRTRN